MTTINKKKQFNDEQIRYTRLQRALLTFLQSRKEEVSIRQLEANVYKMAGKDKPDNSRAAIAGLVRSTSLKIKHIGGYITRNTKLGRGNEAEYSLVDKRGRVRASLEKA